MTNNDLLRAELRNLLDGQLSVPDARFYAAMAETDAAICALELISAHRAGHLRIPPAVLKMLEGDVARSPEPDPA
jgi:anti-sigma factor RsiW